MFTLSLFLMSASYYVYFKLAWEGVKNYEVVESYYDVLFKSRGACFSCFSVLFRGLWSGSGLIPFFFAMLFYTMWLYWYLPRSWLSALLSLLVFMFSSLILFVFCGCILGVPFRRRGVLGVEDLLVMAEFPLTEFASSLMVFMETVSLFSGSLLALFHIMYPSAEVGLFFFILLVSLTRFLGFRSSLHL